MGRDVQRAALILILMLLGWHGVAPALAQTAVPAIEAEDCGEVFASPAPKIAQETWMAVASLVHYGTFGFPNARLLVNQTLLADDTGRRVQEFRSSARAFASNFAYLQNLTRVFAPELWEAYGRFSWICLEQVKVRAENGGAFGAREAAYWDVVRSDATKLKAELDARIADLAPVVDTMNRLQTAAGSLNRRGYVPDNRFVFQGPPLLYWSGGFKQIWDGWRPALSAARDLSETLGEFASDPEPDYFLLNLALSETYTLFKEMSIPDFGAANDVMLGENRINACSDVPRQRRVNGQPHRLFLSDGGQGALFLSMAQDGSAVVLGDGAACQVWRAEVYATRASPYGYGWMVLRNDCAADRLLTVRMASPQGPLVLDTERVNPGELRSLWQCHADPSSNGFRLVNAFAGDFYAVSAKPSSSRPPYPLGVAQPGSPMQVWSRVGVN